MTHTFSNISGRHTFCDQRCCRCMAKPVQCQLWQIVFLENLLEFMRGRADIHAPPVICCKYSVRLRPVFPEGESVFELFPAVTRKQIHNNSWKNNSPVSLFCLRAFLPDRALPLNVSSTRFNKTRKYRQICIL